MPRPHDTVSLLVSLQKISNRRNNAQQIVQAERPPFSNGAIGVEMHEVILERSHEIHATQG